MTTTKAKAYKLPKVDGERIKPGVAYVVRDGRFVAKDAP